MGEASGIEMVHNMTPFKDVMRAKYFLECNVKVAELLNVEKNISHVIYG